MKPAKLVSTAFIVGLACMSLAAVFYARETDPTEHVLRSKYDWVLALKVRDVPNYVSRKTNSLLPITEVESDYWINAQAGSSEESGKYEDLWYYRDLPVGLQRFTPLPVGASSMGAVFVQYDPAMLAETKAVANAVVRIVLDAYCKQAIVARIALPDELFPAVESELHNFRFYPLETCYEGGPGNNMSLHLVSYPNGVEHYFYYQE